MISENATNRVIVAFKKHGVEFADADGKFLPLVMTLSRSVFESWEMGVRNGEDAKQQTIRDALGL